LTIGILTVFLRLLFKSKNSVERTGFLFIASGAIGNIIDRFRVGCVVDFLHFHFLILA
jgi:lipoprotein signal peptidase